MKSAPRLTAIAATVLVLGIGPTVVARDQTGVTASDKIKAVLLRPAGWRVGWSGPSGRGTAEFVYETRGQEVVVTEDNMKSRQACSAHALGQPHGLERPWFAAVAATLALLYGAAAAGQETSYSGEWACDAAPKIDVPAFTHTVVAVRTGDRLTISRTIYRAGTKQEQDIDREAGTGTINNGRVTIDTSTATGRITGRFEGTVSDTKVSLTGTERVKSPERGEDQRACRVTLNRK